MILATSLDVARPGVSTSENLDLSVCQASRYLACEKLNTNLVQN